MLCGRLQHGGYEVYIVEVTDVTAEHCQQRNIHNRTMEDIALAAEQWQPTPPTYPLLDLGTLIGGSKKKAKQVRRHTPQAQAGQSKMGMYVYPFYVLSPTHESVLQACLYKPDADQ